MKIASKSCCLFKEKTQQANTSSSSSPFFLSAGATRKLKSYTDANGNPVPGKWTPGYVSATLADAWAEVLKTKAQAKYNHSETPMVLPMPAPGPSKSKIFAYTSIRLSTDFTGAPAVVPTGGDLLQTVTTTSVPVPPVQQQVANPFATTTSVPISGARPVAVAPVTNPFITTQVPVSGAPAEGAVVAAVPPSPRQSDELQAKLQQLQKQLQELEALKAQLDTNKPAAAAAGSRRKMLDSGLPGWDPGCLRRYSWILLKVQLLKRLVRRWFLVLVFSPHYFLKYTKSILFLMITLQKLDISPKSESLKTEQK